MHWAFMQQSSQGVEKDADPLPRIILLSRQEIIAKGNHDHSASFGATFTQMFFSTHDSGESSHTSEVLQVGPEVHQLGPNRNYIGTSLDLICI